jgi:hypothetical protein
MVIKVNKKRLEITTETYQKITIRRGLQQSDFCTVCSALVQTFSVAFILKHFGPEKDQTGIIFTNNQIHFIENTEMICGNSVANYLKGVHK